MATIYEIAREANVSPSSVSKVLAGKGERYSVSTRALIERVAHNLGYRRNAFAAAVRQGSFGAVGLLHSSIPQHAKIPEGFRNEIERLVSERNLLLLGGQLDEDSLRQAETTPRVLREWAVDGLILFYTHGDWSDLEKLLEQHGVPAVWVNTKLHRNGIFPDDAAAGRLAAERLLGLGHRQIAYFSFTASGHYSETDRRDGAFAALSAAGLPSLDVSAPGEIPPADWLSVADAALNLRGSTTAFICYGPSEVAALMYAAARRSLSVPKNISVITVHDEPADVCGIPVETLVLPHSKIARLALEDLEAQIGGARSRAARAILPELVAGATVAPH